MYGVLAGKVAMDLPFGTSILIATRMYKVGYCHENYIFIGMIPFLVAGHINCGAVYIDRRA